MKSVEIKPSYLKGEVTIPPSKSAAHRAMICSFLAGGGSVNPIIDSSDMKAMNQVLNAIENDEPILDCIESGNTSKFVIPLAAALGKKVTIIGQGRLPQRPIDEYLKVLPKHGITCISDGGLPLSIEGKLKPGVYEVAGNISSQYISGLLMSLPILDGDSKIILTTELQSKPYVDMTIKVMKDYGVEIIEEENGYYIKGNQKFKVQDYVVEGDWSQAAFLLAGGIINGDVLLKGLDLNSAQGDKEIIEIFRKFGGNIEITENGIHAQKSDLHGIEINVSNIPDTVPSIAIVASFAKGKTIITGAERLRFKESDRIKSIVENLQKLGIEVEEKEDGMIINGKNKEILKTDSILESYNDHRIVMAFSMANLLDENMITINDSEAIKKTYPHFFEDYNKLGGNANVIDNRE